MTSVITRVIIISIAEIINIVIAYGNNHHHFQNHNHLHWWNPISPSGVVLVCRVHEKEFEFPLDLLLLRITMMILDRNSFEYCIWLNIENIGQDRNIR